MGEVTEGMPRTRTRARAWRRMARVGAVAVLATISATASMTASMTAGYAVGTTESTVAIVSSQNPSVFGHGVSFTATVTATAGTPTGSVQFDVDGLPAGPAVALVAGVATSPPISAVDGLTLGIHQVDATYSGDATFASSTELVFQQVDSDTTSVTVTSTPNPSLLGQPVTFDVTVISASGAAPPGAVYLSVDGVFIDSASTVGGHASMVETGLLAGAHTVDVVFSPDTSDFVDGQVSLVGGQVVTAGLTTTVTSSTPNPSVFNESVTFTAAVAPVAPATAIPTGTVEFFDGVTSLGVATVDGSGNATLAVSTLPVGVHSITSVFTSADLAAFANSTSAAYNHTVDAAPSAVALGAVPVSPVHGESVTLTAAVTSLGGVPTGTVEFFDGATSLGSEPLVAGSASINTAALSTGSYSLTAVYSGDGNFLASTSSITTLEVGQASTTTAVTPSLSPSVFGQAVSFSAQVSAVAPGAGIPTGTVQFFVDGVVAGGPVAVDGSGVAVSGAIADLGAGSHSIDANYSGDPNFMVSTGNTSQTVEQGETTTEVVSAPNATSFSEQVTMTATVTAAGAASGIPTGSVEFFDGADSLGTGTLSGGVATFSTTTLALGTHSITAVYSGDTNFIASTAPAVDQTVTPMATSFTITVNGAAAKTIGYGATSTLAVSGLPGCGDGHRDVQLAGQREPVHDHAAGDELPHVHNLAVGSYAPISATFTEHRRQLHRIDVDEHRVADGHRHEARCTDRRARHEVGGTVEGHVGGAGEQRRVTDHELQGHGSAGRQDRHGLRFRDAGDRHRSRSGHVQVQGASDEQPGCRRSVQRPPTP